LFITNLNAAKSQAKQENKKGGEQKENKCAKINLRDDYDK